MTYSKRQVSRPTIQPAKGRNVQWHRAHLSPVTIVGGAKLLDFALILSASYLSFIVYFGFLTDLQPGETEHYTLVTLVAAAVFYMGFRWVGGYDFRRLSNLRWQ